MDECLIHSRFYSPHSAKLAHQVSRSTNSTADTISTADDADGTIDTIVTTTSNTTTTNTTVDTFQITLPDGDVVHVYQRPHLQTFLQHVTRRYETHVFTAALSVYANPVLDYLDPYDALAGRWYRESCVLRDGAHVKDLGILRKSNLDRVVLIDNNPLSFLANPENGILVQSFYSDANDQTLLAVLDVLQELEQEPDVKPYLERKFGLKAALQDVR